MKRVAIIWFALSLTAPASARSRGHVRLAPDHHFGCKVDVTKVSTWNPNGYLLPRLVGQKFKLLGRVSRVGDAIPNCTKMTDPKFIIRPAGQGNVPHFDLVVAMQDVKLYRAYSTGRFRCGSEFPAARLGAFWALEDFTTKPIARRKYAICNEWNDFSEKVACTLKAGSVIAVGPTQSAVCQGIPGKDCGSRPAHWARSFDRTREPQVFLNLRNRSSSEIGAFLKDCRTFRWPGRE